MRKISLSTLFLFPLLMATAQQELPLYGNDPIPNSKPAPNKEKIDSGGRPGHYTLSLVSQPTLTVFLPPKGKGNGTAVVICPGGAYTHLAIAHEGLEVARLLNGMGIAAFVLKYRLPSDEIMVDKSIGPLQDAQRAIQLVRQRAREWAIKPERVGILGFSAGGHLASTAGTHFGKATIDNKDSISLRPDFMILIYPVISFSDSLGHRTTRGALIGTSPGVQQVHEYSNELQVTSQTPPTFIVHSEDDKTVPVANSIHFYESLLHNQVPAELHIYPKGGHGYGLHNTTTKDQWADRMRNWMQSNGWLM